MKKFITCIILMSIMISNITSAKDKEIKIELNNKWKKFKDKEIGLSINYPKKNWTANSKSTVQLSNSYYRDWLILKKIHDDANHLRLHIKFATIIGDLNRTIRSLVNKIKRSRFSNKNFRGLINRDLTTIECAKFRCEKGKIIAFQHEPKSISDIAKGTYYELFFYFLIKKSKLFIVELSFKKLNERKLSKIDKKKIKNERKKLFKILKTIKLN